MFFLKRGPGVIRVDEVVSRRWKWWCWCDRDEVSKTQSWLTHSHGRHSRSSSWYWNFKNSRCYWWLALIDGWLDFSLTFEREKVGVTSLWTYCCTFQSGVCAWHRTLEEHAIVQTNTGQLGISCFYKCGLDILHRHLIFICSNHIGI